METSKKRLRRLEGEAALVGHGADVALPPAARHPQLHVAAAALAVGDGASSASGARLGSDHDEDEASADDMERSGNWVEATVPPGGWRAYRRRAATLPGSEHASSELQG